MWCFEMRAIEQIRMYIKNGLQNNTLSAGSQLPSYHEFMNITGTSYATVLSAMNGLQREGLIELLHGKGSFVAGGKTLPVCLLYNPQVISEAAFAGLLNKHLAKTDLNISLKLYPVYLVYNPDEYQRFINEEQHAVIISNEEPPMLPVSNLTGFEDYDENMENAFRLPFTFLSQQFAMNRALVRKTGFKPEEIDSSFVWWESFVEHCKACGVFPGSMKWQANSREVFTLCYGLLLALFGAVPEEKVLLFDSDAGRRLLKILGDLRYYDSPNQDGSFFCNEACMNFNIGSWIAVQNQNPERPDIKVSDLEIVPIARGEKKIKLLSYNYLSAYFGNQATVEERNRVWALMKLMREREFQLDYCNATGMISSREDIHKDEYSWNRQGDMDAFFPGKDDLIFHSFEMFDHTKYAAMTILLEDFLFYSADMDTTLRRMDLKNTKISHKIDPKSGVINIKKGA